MVTAVNARIHAYVEKRNDKKIILEIPQFKIKKEINELDEDEKIKAKFVLSAIQTVNSYICHKGKTPCGLKIKTISDKAFSISSGKSGLGSSAAVTVATVASMLRTYRIGTKKTIHKISQYAHAFAQGKVGSGFDIAVSVYGTIKYSRYSPSIINVADASKIDRIIDSEWDYQITKINWPKNFHIIVGNFKQTSTSTTEMVKKVMEFKKNSISKYTNLMNELNSENENAINFINNPKKFKIHFDNGRMLTKKLGELSGAEIESEKSTKLIETLLQNGAFTAKLPGAGGADSIVVICLNENNRKKVKKILEERGDIEILKLNVENEGVKINTNNGDD